MEPSLVRLQKTLEKETSDLTKSLALIPFGAHRAGLKSQSSAVFFHRAFLHHFTGNPLSANALLDQESALKLYIRPVMLRDGRNSEVPSLKDVTQNLTRKVNHQDRKPSRALKLSLRFLSRLVPTSNSNNEATGVKEWHHSISIGQSS